MAVRKDKTTNMWIVDISCKNAVTGKRKRIVRKNIGSKQLAIQKENELRLVKLNEKIPENTVNIGMLFSLLEKEDRQNERSKTYIASQRYNFNAHIRKYFSNSIISMIGVDDLLNYRNFLAEKNQNLSNNTINKIMILLNKVFDVAVNYNVIEQNPCKSIHQLSIEKKKMSFWTIQEFQIFNGLIKEDEFIFKLFFNIAFFTGMRRGEMLALTWDDVDIFNKKIHVNKSISFINGSINVGPPKTTSGIREIAINQRLLDMLFSWKKEQGRVFQEEYGFDFADSHYIFEEFPEQMLKPSRLRKKYECILKRNTDLKKIRIHDFRHSHVALLIQNEEKDLVIKERLGHASIQTTYDHYGHLYPSKQRSLAEKLDAYF